MSIRHRLSTQRHGLPAFLSLFIPGLGQMVKGRFLLGVGVMFAMFVFTGVLFAAPPVGLVLLLVAWIAQLYDAYASPDSALAADMKRLGVK